jgi:hypothetical protein
MKCKVCGGSYRSGKMVYVVGDKGGLSRTRVCPGCAGNAIQVLPTMTLTLCACGMAATVCGGCSDKREAKAKKGNADAGAIAKQLLMKAKVYELAAKCKEEEPDESDESNQGQYERGLAFAFESAATFLQSGRWT